ncbi:MAG: hypothetical protein RL653_2732 [Pseudomonadota bacterium]|jgi:aromatic ring-opening dioxygenase catalytic subunit (LigB family)
MGENPFTRRELLAGAAALTASACTGTGTAAPRAVTQRMPAVFLPHGGGPWPFVDVGFGEKSELDGLAAYLKGVRYLPREAPKALLVVSAHWETAVPTVMTGKAPPLFFDYSGFPPESYALTWPAPGSPELAARVRALLGKAGFASAEDATRGFDHGTFVPLKLTWPEAALPTVQLSLRKGLDPSEHLALGRALQPLRDEGVFILGSGMTFHNLRAFGPRSRAQGAAFEGWLAEALTAAPAVRDARLKEWTRAPYARFAHPYEDHLLPLMVVAGAAGDERGVAGWSGTLAGVPLSAWHFG